MRVVVHVQPRLSAPFTWDTTGFFGTLSAFLNGITLRHPGSAQDLTVLVLRKPPYSLEVTGWRICRPLLTAWIPSSNLGSIIGCLKCSQKHLKETAVWSMLNWTGCCLRRAENYYLIWLKMMAAIVTLSLSAPTWRAAVLCLTTRRRSPSYFYALGWVLVVALVGLWLVLGSSGGRFPTIYLCRQPLGIDRLGFRFS